MSDTDLPDQVAVEFCTTCRHPWRQHCASVSGGHFCLDCIDDVRGPVRDCEGAQIITGLYDLTDHVEPRDPTDAE